MSDIELGLKETLMHLTEFSKPQSYENFIVTCALTQLQIETRGAQRDGLSEGHTATKM